MNVEEVSCALFKCEYSSQLGKKIFNLKIDFKFLQKSFKLDKSN